MSSTTRKPNHYRKGYKGPLKADGFSKLGRAIRKHFKKLKTIGQMTSGHKGYKMVRVLNPVR